MNRTEHLLCILSEECNEVAQRVSKALRFGLDEIQGGQTLNNRERILGEYADLLGVMELLKEEGVFDTIGFDDLRMLIDMKKNKVERYLGYSAEQGTLV